MGKKESKVKMILDIIAFGVLGAILTQAVLIFVVWFCVSLINFVAWEQIIPVAEALGFVVNWFLYRVLLVISFVVAIIGTDWSLFFVSED